LLSPDYSVILIAGHDRGTLQAELALRIQEVLTTNVQRDPLHIANRAIGRVREELRQPQPDLMTIGLAS
jgi:hypothetical protein